MLCSLPLSCVDLISQLVVTHPYCLTCMINIMSDLEDYNRICKIADGCNLKNPAKSSGRDFFL